MKPNEFWSSTYREINIFTQVNLAKQIDDFKQDIQLQEAVTDKLIMADGMSQRHPKIQSLKKTFASLFPKENKDTVQSPQEIVKRMRNLIKSEKK